MIKKLSLLGLCCAAVLIFATERIASNPASSDPPSPPSAQAEDQPQRPEIVWRKRMANGMDLGVVSEPDTLDGKTVRATTPYSVKPKDFVNDDTYYGELPADVRGETDFVHFILRGTAREKPEEGTVLNIDGAILGFTAKYDEQSGRSLAELVARSVNVDGAVQWIPLGILFRPRPGQHVPLPRLTVRFNRADNIWGLHLGDVIIREGLHLSAEAPRPTISVRAGQVGDTARLLDLKIDDKAPPAGERGLKATNGKIDLKKEYESGNPRIKVFGLNQ